MKTEIAIFFSKMFGKFVEKSGKYVLEITRFMLIFDEKSDFVCFYYVL